MRLESHMIQICCTKLFIFLLFHVKHLILSPPQASHVHIQAVAFDEGSPGASLQEATSLDSTAHVEYGRLSSY